MGVDSPHYARGVQLLSEHEGAAGFTVIQTVILSEFDGVTQPSALGEKRFLDAEFRKPNPAYFDRVAEIVDEAAAEFR